MIKIYLLCFTFCFKIISEPFPIGFSIPKSKIINYIPKKKKDFAFIIPGKLDTYIYNNEADYYKDYQESYFAITKKKAGWDCMRHYEILANGCILYFIDIDKCPKNTMTFFPKNLVKKAMNIDGVSYGKIDHKKFNYNEYNKILRELLYHAKKHLTCKNMARYILSKVKYSGLGKILILSGEAIPDYMKMCTIIGLKKLLGTKVIDYPKEEYLYSNYAKETNNLYGKGFSYTKIIIDEKVDRSNLKQRIQNKEFELIIYGSVHRGLPFYNTVLENYPKNKIIIYIDGEDIHKCNFLKLHNLFLREY